MYNPCRGGVRGGADQFSWDSVKTDKHRENYLGHSLKAPVGRWQKGKDLSWYSKERKDGESAERSEKLELAVIKKAEEEAMLIALGHNVIKKESQGLSKEEMAEALKRNISERDELNIERIDGVGVTSGRAALLAGIPKNTGSKKEGVFFETHYDRNTTNVKESEKHKSSKSKKKSKKHKKEKKKKRERSKSSEDSETEAPRAAKKKKHSKRESSGSESESFSKKGAKKEAKHTRHDSSDSDDPQMPTRDTYRTEKSKERSRDTNETERESYAKRRDEKELKRTRHDSSDSDEGQISSRKGYKRLTNMESGRDSTRSSHRKKKHRHQRSDSENSPKRNSDRQRVKNPLPVKRRRHDTSESD